MTLEQVKNLQVGDLIKMTVYTITWYGVIVDIGPYEYLEYLGRAICSYTIKWRTEDEFFFSDPIPYPYGFDFSNSELIFP